MQATIAGDAALEVQAAGEGLFDESRAAQLSAVPGVSKAMPVFEQKTVMYADGGLRISLILLGIDPQTHDLEREYDLAAGRMLQAGDEVLLDAAFAQGAGLKVGDEVRLLARSGRISVTVVGLLKPRTGAAVGQGSVLFMPLATVQKRYRADGRINRVQIVVAEDADINEAQAEIARGLPTGLTVRSSAARSQMGEETMRSLQSALFMATGFALVAAVFIVGNAFFMNVTQRRRQLAVMRAIGATQVQSLRLILREALIMALVGTAVGLAVGWGGAVLLSNAMERLYRTDLPTPALTPLVVTLAVTVGVLVSLGGALLPALKAARVQPVEACTKSRAAMWKACPVG
jgi:putative ABC transport system permease protein